MRISPNLSSRQPNPRPQAALYAALLVVWLLGTNVLTACQCIEVEAGQAPNRAVPGWRSAHPEFFLGTVINVQVLQIPSRSADSFVLAKVALIQVNRMWNGRHVWRKSVYTGGSGPDCGVDFQVGQQYVVAEEKDDQLTRLLSDEIEPGSIVTNRCVTILYDPENDGEWIKKLEKEYPAWVPRIQVQNSAP